MSLKPVCKHCAKTYIQRTMFCYPTTRVHEWSYMDTKNAKVKVFQVGEALVYWYKELLHEVPNGATGASGFTIEGHFHLVKAGDDVRTLVEQFEKERL